MTVIQKRLCQTKTDQPRSARDERRAASTFPTDSSRSRPISPNVATDCTSSGVNESPSSGGRATLRGTKDFVDAA